MNPPPLRLYLAAHRPGYRVNQPFLSEMLGVTLQNRDPSHLESRHQDDSEKVKAVGLRKLPLFLALVKGPMFGLFPPNKMSKKLCLHMLFV